MIKFIDFCWSKWYIRYSVFLLSALWAFFLAGAIYYNFKSPTFLRFSGILLICALFYVRTVRNRMAIFLLMLAVLNGVYFISVRPSNHRDWKASFQRNAYGVIDGDRLTINNVRDFHYRSEDDFDVNYITEVYDLSKLDELDFIVVHWGSEAIAHTMIGFHFSDGKALVFSMETRLENNDSQGAIPGLFRQFELLCIAGTERDLIGLRTNFRKEDVYFCPTTSTGKDAKIHLIALVNKLNSLNERPEFYNTITQNCTTSLAPLLKPDSRRSRDFRVLCNGFSDQLSFESGELRLDFPGQEFSILKANRYLNPKIGKKNIYTDNFDYSAEIRKID